MLHLLLLLCLNLRALYLANLRLCPAVRRKCEPQPSCSGISAVRVFHFSTLEVFPDFIRDPAISTDGFKRVLVTYLCGYLYCLRYAIFLLFYFHDK